jgi:hypothetical protein
MELHRCLILPQFPILYNALLSDQKSLRWGVFTSKESENNMCMCVKFANEDVRLIAAPAELVVGREDIMDSGGKVTTHRQTVSLIFKNSEDKRETKLVASYENAVAESDTAADRNLLDSRISSVIEKFEEAAVTHALWDTTPYPRPKGNVGGGNSVMMF